MSELEKRVHTGLQIWHPKDSFTQPYNIVNFEECLSGLQIADVLHKPEETTIYTVGPGRVALQVVGEHEVATQLKRFLDGKNKDVSCLQGQKLRSDHEVMEESRVRALHLALGRTCMIIAAQSDTIRDFRKATDDLKRVFSIISAPAHHAEGMMYAYEKKSINVQYEFVKAGRRHRALTEQEAADLAKTLSRGFYREPSGRPWSESYGYNLAKRIGFPEQQKPRPKSSKGYNKTKIQKLDAGALGLREGEAVELPDVLKIPEKTHEQRFLDSLDPVAADKSTSQLTRVHKLLCVERRLPDYVNDNTRDFILDHGLKAYLLTEYSKKSVISAEIRAYLGKKRQTDIHRLLIAGNLITAKVNAGQGFVRGAKRPLPGLDDSGMTTAFRNIRYAIRHGIVAQTSQAREPKNARILGDIVGSFIELAYKKNDEVNFSGNNPQTVQL